jgi:hypothetical protein
MIIDTALKGAGFALIVYLFTFVVAAAVGGMMLLLSKILRRSAMRRENRIK